MTPENSTLARRQQMPSDKRDDEQSTKTLVGRYGMNKIIGGIVVTVMAGLILAMTGWNFSETAAAPEKFADRKENKTDHDNMNNKIDTNQRELMKEVKEVQRLILELHK
jgi:hypothetical protein